ncbi:unnamed protein product [Prunus brigantina]
MSEVKKQIGQMAEFMGQFREEGKLPSSTIVNPKGGFETAKAIILRSGKEIGINPKMSKQSPTENEKLLFKEKEEDKAMAREEQPLLQSPKAPAQPNSGKVVPNSTHSNPIPPNVPFPRKYMQFKKEENEKDILETFKKVQINIPLLNAIAQIPKYAKFLKDLCTNKRRFKEHEQVALSEEVSAVLQRKLPPKLKDPGSFSIPCIVGDFKFQKALLDLGASINLMPYHVYEKLNLGELQATTVSIQLADRTIRYPKGILEDVLVNVEGLILPADFLVLEMEEAPIPNNELPLIFGRPFMATAKTKIDVEQGTLTMTVNGETVAFKVFDALKPNVVQDCFHIEVFGNPGKERFDGQSCLPKRGDKEEKGAAHMFNATIPTHKKGLPKFRDVNTIHCDSIHKQKKKRKAARKRWKKKTSLVNSLALHEVSIEPKPAHSL